MNDQEARAKAAKLATSLARRIELAKRMVRMLRTAPRSDMASRIAKGMRDRIEDDAATLHLYMQWIIPYTGKEKSS